MSSLQGLGPVPILLYDGACGFCAGSVQFVLRHERTRVLRFAPLDGAIAREVRTAWPDACAEDTMMLLDGSGSRPRLRSDAALGVAALMGGPWRLAAIARVVPRRLRDAVYDFVARHRHRLAGAQACLVPPAEAAHRFLVES